MSDSSSSISANPTTTHKLTGYVGLGEPLSDASVSIVDVTDKDNPVILATTTTNGEGMFSTTIATQTLDAKILFVASLGSYLDPLSFQGVSNLHHILEGIWKFKYLPLLETINVTPLTTLASAFYKCLSNNDALATDPLDYSLAIFNSLFAVNLNVDIDTYLSTSKSSPDPSLYSLYNVAFAKMAKESGAASAMAILSAFSGHLEEECDLLGPTAKQTGSYSFHRESFRRDYLNALENLRLEPAFLPWVDDFDLEGLVDEIRSTTNILFEFGDYK